METLATRFTPDFVADKINELCHATHMTTGGNLIPDSRAREGGLKLLLAYLVGLPVQRQEIVQVSLNGSEMRERLATSPAMQEALQKLMQRAGITPPAPPETGK
jgi:hypothetical protein